MFEIQTPFTIRGIPLKPELSGRQKVDETLIQTLSALLGFDGESRRLLTCALNGSLHTVTPPLEGITNVASSSPTEGITFSEHPTTEIIVMANKNNSGDVWVNVGVVAGVDTGWLLAPGDHVQFSINNMKQLHLHVVTSGDKVIILRTV